MSCPKVAKRLSGKGVWKKYPLQNAPAPVWQASVERKRGFAIHGSVLMMETPFY